jgi:phospholipid/cholesterol/gamma-HCH transport system substrate-binding protein
MNNDRMQFKVGFFVVVGVFLIVGVSLIFSKGFGSWTPTYELHLRTPNAAGIKLDAGVLMAGVRVGEVSRVELSTDGKSVVLVLKLLERIKVHGDAQFKIEMAGFLGDQYVSITPTENAKPVFKPNEEAFCPEPFNIQAAARAAQNLVQRLDGAVQKVDNVVARVDRTILAEETLTNLTSALANFQKISSRLNTVGNNLEEVSLLGVKMAGRVDSLLLTNAMPLTHSISNLVQFSTKLDRTAADLERLVASNKVGISDVIRNAETATAAASKILDDLEKGRGLAGGLLKNEALNAQFAQLVTNLNAMVATYATFGSNLNAHGIFYKPSSGPAPKLRSVKPQD